MTAFLTELLRDLTRHRARTSLSAVCLLLVIGSVVAIESASAVAREVFVADEEQRNGRAVTAVLALPGAGANADTLRRLDAALERRVRADGGSATIEVEMSARAGRADVPVGFGVLGNVRLIAIAGDPTTIRRLPVLFGRMPRTALPPAVLLNAAARERWHTDRLTLQATPGSPTFTARVEGVVSDGSPDPVLWVPWSTVAAFDPAAFRASSTMTVLAHVPGASYASIVDEMRAAVQEVGLVAPVASFSRSDDVPTIERRLRTTRSGFLLASVVALVIAVVALFNINVASVRERQRELVVRRAFGASRARIALLVLCSSLLVAVLASGAANGVAALCVHLLGPAILPRASPVLAPHFPLGAAVTSTAVGLVASLLSAAYPAVLASRVQIAGALRD